jgi:predicted PurR-regulated permease PerM
VGKFDQARENVRRAYEAGRATVRAAHAPVPEAAVEPEVEPDVRVVHSSVTSADDAEIPHAVRLAAAWSWRFIVILLFMSLVLWALTKLHEVLIPLSIAMLLSALLSPAVQWLRRHGMNRSFATSVVLIGGVLLVAGTLTLVVTEFVNNYSSLVANSKTGLNKIQSWLKGGLFHLTDKQFSSLVNSAQDWLTTHQSSLTTGAIATATTAVTVLVSMLLVLFTTFFLLRDGDIIWRFLVSLLPRQTRGPVGEAGQQSWLTLVAYVRATVLVAFIDAVGIGIWLAVWRVELAFALAALVFLGAFIPIIGATLSGAVAVLVALVTRGPITALIVLGGVIGVQQLEGHILQPLIMGRAVKIHPLAVILAIATGLVLAGIIGALVAVPIVAVLNTGIRHLSAHRRHEPDPPPPTAVVVGD